MLAYCYSQELEHYSDRLPSNLGRSSLLHSLASAYKLLQRADVMLIQPEPTSRHELLQYHALDYVEMLLNGASCALTEVDLSRFGLEYDCPVFEELAEYVRYIAGASITAARALTRYDKSVSIAVNFDGGRHHAKRACASGFCYVQDIVLAIQELRKSDSRVLYIDLDLHHGDAVEAAFQHSDRVYTLSIHRYDRGFFPNSGTFDDQGSGKGKGFSLNIPLRRGLSDQSLLVLTDEVIIPVINSYLKQGAKQSVVVQCGVDSLAADPCNEFNLSIEGYCATIAKIQRTASTLGAKLLILGGGGYNKSAASRCYSAILATMLHVTLGDIPDHEYWTEYADTDYELALTACNAAMPDENEPSLSALITDVQARLALTLRT